MGKRRNLMEIELRRSGAQLVRTQILATIEHVYPTSAFRS